MGDFKIKFGPSTPEPEGTTAPIGGTQSLPPQPGMVDEQHQDHELDLLHQRAIEDLTNVQTLIDDPLQFESDLIDDMTTEKGRGDDSKERRRVREAI